MKWCILQHGWNLKHGKWKKSFTKHHTHLWFCLYEMARTEKSKEIESKLVVSQGCEVWGKWGTTVKGCRISFWGEKSVSKLGCAHGCTTLNKYTENHWNGWSVWHMNYISISWFCKSNFRMYRITRLRSRLRYRNGLRQLSFYKHESVTHCYVANHLETYQLRTTTIFILVINLQTSVGTNCLCPIWHHLGPLDWGPPMAQLAGWYGVSWEFRWCPWTEHLSTFTSCGWFLRMSMAREPKRRYTACHA